MEGKGGYSFSLDGNISGEDSPPAHATHQPLSSSMCQCICCPHQLIKEVKEAVEREVLVSLPTILDGAVQRGIQNLTPAVIDAMKQMIPTIVPLLQSSTLPSASRSSLDLGDTGASRTLQLRFVDQPVNIFTCRMLREQKRYFTVELHNEYGVVVKDGPESSVKIKFFVLPGDFKVEDDLTGKGFSEHIVKVRPNKPQTLVGTFEHALHQGVARFEDFMITDNSSWMTDKKFRLGANVVGGSIPGVTIREAVSEPFRVKERRGELHQKHEIPSLEDPVHRLHLIGKEIYQRLKANGINTVNDLLGLQQANENSLKEILNVGDGTFSKIKDQAYLARYLATGSYGVQDATMGVLNDATNPAYGNQTEGLAVHGPNSQMLLPTQNIGAAISLTAENLVESEMQKRFNFSSEITMQSPASTELEGFIASWFGNSDKQDQSVRTFEEGRTKSSSKWCVIRAANRVISLRRIVIMASTRPQKKPRMA